MPLPTRQQALDLLNTQAKRHRRGLRNLGIGLVVVAVLGFLVAPPIVRWVAEKQLSAALHRPVTVADVDINPFALSATVEGLAVGEPDGSGEALGFDRLYVNLELESLFRGGPVLQAVQLDKPRLKLRRGKDGRYNWQDLVEEFLAKPSSDEKTLFAVNNIQVTGGQIEIDDEAEGVVHKLSDLQIGVPFISSIPSQVEIFVEPVVSAKVNDRPFNLSGQTQPFSQDRETRLALKLDGLVLPPYLHYAPFEPAFRLPGAQLSTDLTLSFEQTPAGEARLGLKGSVVLADVELQDKDGAPVLKLARLGVDIADADLTGRKLHLAKVRLEGPQVELKRGADGALNLLGLLPTSPPSPSADAAPAPAQPAQPFAYQVDRIEVAGGEVGISDAAVQPAFATRLKDIQVEVDHLASQGDPAQVKLALVSEAGEKVEHAGSLRPAPLEAQGEIRISGLALARYGAYAAVALPEGQIDSGSLDATLGYTLAMGDQGPQVGLSLPSSTLTDLALRLKGDKETLARVGRLELADGKLDLAGQKVGLGRIVVDRPQLALVRDKQGQFNAAGLAGEAKPAPAQAPAKASAPVKGAAPAPWTLTVGELGVQGGTLRLEDRGAERPIVMLAEQLAVKVQDFSTAPGAKARVSVESRINQKGRLAVKGSLALAPLATDLELDLDGVDLLPASPYLSEYLLVSLSRGSVSARGKLGLELPPGGEPKGRFTGDLRFQDLATIDKISASDFVKWKSFSFDKMDLRLAPFALSIREVALTDFYTRLILNDKGELNLREITVRQKGEEEGKIPTPAAKEVVRPAPGVAVATVPPPAAPPPPIRIDRIVLKGGNIAYSDRFIKPNYDANLTGMAGTLAGLSSDPATIAELDLAGKVDNAAPVTVKGKLNPFRQDRYLDIRAEMKGFDLPGLSAYSGKYVGYGIQKGKLSATLGYKVENRQLTATNRIFLDQLTFGDKVDSPDALKLPVQLAVSLLKNSRGEIDIDLPISGSLDDPEFSVGGIIFKAIMNLLVKAITAPFSLLGSLFSGGADLSYVEFGPGQAILTPAATEKLQGMAKALADRPALKVELAGRVDPVADLEGLKRETIRTQMAAFKIKEQVKKGEAAPSLDEVVIDPAEYSALLKRVYKDGDFKKPRNLVGLAKDLPDAEMEALLLQNITVSEDDLRNLGRRRGQQVEDWLIGKGQVSPERMFVLSPRIGEEGKETQAKTSRVDFSIK